MTESEKQRKKEQDIPSEDSIEFVIENGADIVIINEDRGNFVPLFLFSCEQVSFHQNSGINQMDKMDGTADTKCSVYYFNSTKGYWEPAVESFSIWINLSRVGKVNTQVVRLPEPININISVRFGSVVNDFLKLWEKSTKRAKSFQKKMQKGQESMLRTSSIFRTGDALQYN